MRQNTQFDDHKYRLIWFQHFHKAGGSSVVNLAKINGEVFENYHINGNPCNNRNKQLPLWLYGDDELSKYIDDCEKRGVTFVATEWGCPNFSLLKKDERVVTITSMRRPFDRILSNYIYDIRSNYEKPMDIFDYYEHHFLTFRQPNYYTRMLASGAGFSKCVSESMFSWAVNNIINCDVITYLERNDPFLSICDFLGWKQVPVHSNKISKWRKYLSALRRGRLSILKNNIWLDLSQSERQISEFEKHFNELNKEDCDLYETVKELSDKKADDKSTSEDAQGCWTG